MWCDNIEMRRLKGEIKVFKIWNGYENIDRSIFWSLKKNKRTREHEEMLLKEQCGLNITTYSFSQMTITEY